MTVSFHETTMGHIGKVDGEDKWFIKKQQQKNEIYETWRTETWEVWEIVKPPNGCMLRDRANNLNAAKAYVYKEHMPTINLAGGI